MKIAVKELVDIRGKNQPMQPFEVDSSITDSINRVCENVSSALLGNKSGVN